MDGDLYDEFGNYIGPELESDSDGEGEAEDYEAEEDLVKLSLRLVNNEWMCRWSVHAFSLARFYKYVLLASGL